MFGGVGFMLNGNLLAGASKQGLLLRIGKERHAEAVAEPGVRAMEQRGRVMEGYVYADPPPASDVALKAWLERALSIREKSLGQTHPLTNLSRANLAFLRLQEGAPSDALALGEVALAAHAKVLGAEHPRTKNSARVTARARDALGRGDEARAVRKQYGIEGAPA